MYNQYQYIIVIPTVALIEWLGTWNPADYDIELVDPEYAEFDYPTTSKMICIREAYAKLTIYNDELFIFYKLKYGIH